MNVEALNQIVDQKLRDLINERELQLYRIIEYQMGWDENVDQVSIVPDEFVVGIELVSNPFGVLCLVFGVWCMAYGVWCTCLFCKILKQ